jgi:peptidoglycan hydrolase-like protein with peptidoglycan-binding domain
MFSDSAVKGFGVWMALNNANNKTSELQQRLNELKYVGKDGKPLPVNGTFDENTLHAVNEFKKLNQIGNSGIYEGKVGETTWEALMSDSALQHPDSVTKETSTLDSALEKAVKLTGSFEGRGFVNVTGNFDGAGLSLGFFQWNIGQGSLQPMLSEFFTNYPEKAKEIFGKNYKSVINMLDSSKENQMVWAKSINNGKKLQPEWYNQFTALSQTSEFQSIQVSAMKQWRDQAYKITNDYNLKTERG